ncbi:DUF1905 domain-containing protein [Lutimonas sp.]|uniref:DUF1905 domain-containing protein n=1 Tax=Lutimonas sp. TaxID=1872403 RepID=UPI003D9BD853
MEARIEYAFIGVIWRHDAPGGWYFVSLPKDISREIKENLGWQEEGWGRMKARARIGILSWETAIWFDSKKKTYIIPMKAEIRKKASLEVDMKIDISIMI